MSRGTSGILLSKAHTLDAIPIVQLVFFDLYHPFIFPEELRVMKISDIVIGIVIAWMIIRGIERLADLLEEWRKSPWVGI